MKQYFGLTVGMLAGVVIGAGFIGGMNAQTKGPGAYAVVDISEITNRDLFQTLLPKSTPAMVEFGGKYVIRTENTLALDGAPPKRFVVIAFDSIEKAKAWDASPAEKEVNDIRMRSTKSRVFIVDGTIQQPPTQ